MGISVIVSFSQQKKTRSLICLGISVALYSTYIYVFSTNNIVRIAEVRINVNLGKHVCLFVRSWIKTRKMRCDVR